MINVYAALVHILSQYFKQIFTSDIILHTLYRINEGKIYIAKLCHLACNIEAKVIL